MKPYSVPLPNQVFRRVFRPIFRLVFHLLSDVRIVGRENVPKNGPYLITINHVSLFEPPFLLAFWPIPPEGAGAVDIWDRPGQGILVRFYHGIPIHRGEFDRRSLETMIAVLQSGRPLLLAPEGGRAHELGMRRALPGVAYIVAKTHVPVVPVGIVGTTDDFLHRGLHLHREKAPFAGKLCKQMQTRSCRPLQPWCRPNTMGSIKIRESRHDHNASQDLHMVIQWL